MKALIDSCNVMGLTPTMVNFPYPEIKVYEQNSVYADILRVDYCGAVSELSAITQYINNQTIMTIELCSMSKVLLSIAMAEMMHLEKLGQLIVLLGGKLEYKAMSADGDVTTWTPDFLELEDTPKKMIKANILSEQQAIAQYKEHIKMIDDPFINDVIRRIIMDEEYHLFLFQAMLNEV